MKLNYLTPKEQRYLNDLAGLVDQRRVALFLGGGIDQALCDKMPSWYKLVRDLFDSNETELPDSFMTMNLQALPTVARHKLGDEAFTQKINEKCNNPNYKTGIKTFTTALNILADSVPLIITTNYSPAIYKKLDDKRPVVELRTLKSVHVPNPGSFKGKLFVHLHGTTASPVLDAAGYRSAEYGEVLYYEFLRELLSKWTVLFCGVSFTDPPLLAAAAQVKQRYPEISHRHFIIQTQNASTSEPNFHLQTLGRAIAYDVQTIRINRHNDLPKAWSNMVAPPRVKTIIDAATAIKWVKEAQNTGMFSTLADFFDQSGDYEAASQRFFFHVVSKQKNELRQLVDKFKNQVKDISSQAELKIFLRLERHWRHMLYLAGGEFAEEREKIWRNLLEEWNKKWNNNKRIWGLHSYSSEINKRLLADFYYGFYETGACSSYRLPPDLLNKIKTKLSSVPKYNKRIEIAKTAWTKPTASNEEDFVALRSMAFETRWESLDAKLSIDIVRARILKLNKPSVKLLAKDIDAVQALCSQAKRIAKAAGTTRRYISTLLLSALWMPDQNQAQASVRAASELCLHNDEPMVEESLWDGICWVWHVVHNYDKSALPEIDPNAELSKLKKVQKKYWKDFLSPFYGK